MHFNKVYKEDCLYAAFSYFDKDGSGYITVNEIQQSCKELGINDSQVEEVIKEADLNNVSFHYMHPAFMNFYFNLTWIVYRILNEKLN